MSDRHAPDDNDRDTAAPPRRWRLPEVLARVRARPHWERTRIAIACAGSALLLVALLRVAGLLEPLGLAAYDRLATTSASAGTVESRVAVLLYTERDAVRYGWPISDSALAAVISRLAAQRAAVIGMDLYRTEVPLDGVLARAIDAALDAGVPLVFVEKRGARGRSDSVPPPRALSADASVGFTDYVLDRDNVVRRALYYERSDATGESPRYSLSYLLAHEYQLSRSGDAPIPLDRARPFTSDDGDYVRADDRGYQSLLDPPRVAPRIATLGLSDLLDGQLPASAVAGRVVLLGTAMPSCPDIVRLIAGQGGRDSPGDPGVMLHALATAQLLRRTLDDVEPLRTAPESAEWLLLLAMVIVGASLGGIARSIGWSLGGTLIVLAGLAASAYAALRLGWWVPVVPPALGFVTSAALTTAVLSVQERRMRAMLMQLFSRHLSSTVALDIWHRRSEFLAGGRPRPQRLPVTVLFADLKGYTSTAERVDADALMQWINAFMETMADEIVRQGGVIDDYAGDGIKADFGVPFARHTPDEVRDDARRALHCALAMGSALEQLNARWLAAGDRPAAMRIGVASGFAVAGSIGSAERLKYTVVGDVVNVAARLESLDVPHDFSAQPSRVLVSQATQELLPDEFRYAPLGAMKIKGKEQAVHVHRLLGATSRALSSGAAAIAMSATT